MRLINPYIVKRLIFLSLLFFFSFSRVHAQELFFEYDPDEPVSETSSTRPISTKDSFVAGYRQLFDFNEEEIAGLEAVLAPLRDDVLQLDNQLSMISLQMNRTNDLISVINEKISGLRELKTNLSLQDQFLSLEMKDMMSQFARVLEMVFRVKSQFITEDGSRNFFRLFAIGNSPSDVIFQDILLSALQRQLLEELSVLTRKRLQHLKLTQHLQQITNQLLIYQDRLLQSSEVFAQQQEYKRKLIEDKSHEETFFLSRLKESKKERLLIIDRIRKLAGGISLADIGTFPAEKFQWAVPPVLGVSAYFHDQEYFDRFGIQHNAIDIPTDQLTPVRAAMSGRVIEVHDGGMGYSYMQLAHRDGFSSVYGHLFSFSKQKGDIVKQGEIIGLSGGAIGTQGAGALTTGPHLHFELLKNGIYIDPLRYLPSIDSYLYR